MDRSAPYLQADIAQRIDARLGSVTERDPLTGQGIIIPYGLNVNGTSWIDPAGTDITADLVPQKSVNINGVNVTTEAASTTRIRGGGDMLAYQFVGGTGGTSDLLSWNFVGNWHL